VGGGEKKTGSGAGKRSKRTRFDLKKQKKKKMSLSMTVNRKLHSRLEPRGERCSEERSGGKITGRTSTPTTQEIGGQRRVGKGYTGHETERKDPNHYDKGNCKKKKLGGGALFFFIRRGVPKNWEGNAQQRSPFTERNWMIGTQCLKKNLCRKKDKQNNGSKKRSDRGQGGGVLNLEEASMLSKKNWGAKGMVRKGKTAAVSKMVNIVHLCHEGDYASTQLGSKIEQKGESRVGREGKDEKRKKMRVPHKTPKKEEPVGNTPKLVSRLVFLLKLCGFVKNGNRKIFLATLQY